MLQNEEASAKYCQAELKQLSELLMESISRGTFFVPGGHNIYLEAKKKIEQDYTLVPRKGIKVRNKGRREWMTEDSQRVLVAPSENLRTEHHLWTKSEAWQYLDVLNLKIHNYLATLTKIELFFSQRGFRIRSPGETNHFFYLSNNVIVFVLNTENTL